MFRKNYLSLSYFATALFFSTPELLDMPRAEAYFVKDEHGTIRLEDRYRPDDIWLGRRTIGQWRDDDKRLFALFRLDKVPPKAAEETLTRQEYGKSEASFDPQKELDIRDESVMLLSPVEITDEIASPRQNIRGLREVLYYEGTNENAIVCAFLPEKPRIWYLATWELAEGDDREWARELFEKYILEKWDEVVEKELPSERLELEASDTPPGRERSKRKKEPTERELLRLDARHSVTNYSTWRVTEANEFSVLDNIPAQYSFIQALTNDLSRMRKAYQETLPSPVDGSNTLCVARIFASRDEYLAAAGEGMEWSAAYWNSRRRELVAYLPEDGTRELIKTIRHEAFHQYLSYAGCMITSSPWINEGYAQYFEDMDDAAWKIEVSSDDLEKLSEALGGVMGMDYETFYSGDDATRRLKYRIAWSIAYFLEKGAPQIRFRPFENLKRDYIAALLETKDMRRATEEAFGTQDKFDLFKKEWLKFWKNM